MPDDVALGIDLGTSALKVALVSPEGAVVAGERVILRGQSPAAWWQALQRALRTLHDVAPGRMRAVRAIGVSGRGGGTCLLDGRGRLLAPPGVGRAAASPRFDALTGRAARLRPLASHVDAVLSERDQGVIRLRYVLAAKDVMVQRLTGAAITDPASGPDALSWPLAELGACGFPLGALPAVGLPWECAGALMAAEADALELPSGIPVAVGAHDGVAAQIGTGMLHFGDAALTLGTHAVLRIVVERQPAGAGRFRFYSLWGEADPRTVYGGNARLGGSSVAWFIRLFAGGERARQMLEQSAAALPAGTEEPLFLPYLGGMYYPEQRFTLRGAFLGLAHEHSRAHLYRAVLQGAAYALRHIEEALAHAGVTAVRVRLTGAGSRSAFWRRLLADTLGRPLECSPAATYAECVGAARCAWVAAGTMASLDEAVASGRDEYETVSPDPTWRARIDADYARWRAAGDAVWQAIAPSGSG